MHDIAINYQADWVTAILLVVLFMIWSIWRNAGGFLAQKSFEVLHGYERRSLFSKETAGDYKVSILLSLEYILITSVFVYQLLLYFSDGPFLTIFSVASFVIVLNHFVKIMVVKYWCYLTNVGSQFNIWIKSYYVFNYILGLFFFPLVVLLAYTHGFSYELLLNIGLFFYLIYLIVLFVRMLNIFFSNISSLLYVILYFCTLEILPVLMVAKWVL